MAIHKLDLGEFDEIDYYLIAIHTSLEDYRLAYFINQMLPINLSKNENEIQINNATIFWQDQKGRKLKTAIDVQRFRLSNGIRQHQSTLVATTPWSSNPINIEV